MTIAEIRRHIIRDEIDDIPFEDLKRVCEDPGKYKLSFGEYARVVNKITNMCNQVNAALDAKTRDDLKKRFAIVAKNVQNLTAKVDKIEAALSKMGSVFIESDDEY